MHSYFCVGAGLGAWHSALQVVRLVPVTDSVHLPRSHVYFSVVGLGGAGPGAGCKPDVHPVSVWLLDISENKKHLLDISENKKTLFVSNVKPLHPLVRRHQSQQ